MATLLNRHLAACAVALAAAGLACAPATASETHPKAKTVLKKKKEAKKDVVTNPDEPEPDITDTVATNYSCELGNKVTIYSNDTDNEHIALRWKNRLHRLNRVGTSTGALRFENSNFGLVWIGIPAKGILLDSKQGRQLANECKSPEQSRMAANPPSDKQG